ncbi:MAG: hypothetical protein QNK43_07290 [Amphritea sp.]|nr:hypothetical protein [Amphritea sp.]
MKRCLSLICLLLLVCLSPIAEANCGVDALAGTSNKLGKLDIMYSNGCFGGEQDPGPLTKVVTRGLKKVTDDATNESELSERRNQLLALIVMIKGSLTNAMATMDSKWQGYATITINEMASAKSELRNFESTVRASYWFRGQEYGFFEQPTTGTFLIPYEVDIDAACPVADMSNDCRAALESLIVLTRHINLVHQVLKNPVRERLHAIHTELVSLDAEWDYFFNDARSQFWWEFIANNALYDPAGDSLARPPAGQLILLHPNAAMEYVGSNATVEKAYNLVGIIDVIGYNRLRWREDDPYSKWPLGASLVATYVPATPGDDFGYGLMVHVKNEFSFGATRRDTGAGTETTWLFSVDLTKLFLEKSAEAKKHFRSLK